MNHIDALVAGILVAVLAIQPVATTSWKASATTPLDSVKKQPAKRRASPVEPDKASSAHYSPPGHYTVTVPVNHGSGGKADLVLVNGTKKVARIGDVDANTIESIEVLKDAKNIAKYKDLYGDIASKGIVIIHLKNKTL
ncbi:hypothetical protein [Spirosoma aerophilum]